MPRKAGDLKQFGGEYRVVAVAPGVRSDRVLGMSPHDLIARAMEEDLAAAKAASLEAQ